MQPRSFDPTAPDDGDLAACRALLANGSKSFFAASFLLPSEMRDAATALYAFCRLADDLVDIPGAEPPAVMAELRVRLERAYAGDPAPVPADRAFARIVRRYRVPRELPLALLEGFEWDGETRRYETFEDLTAYALRVAGTVGMMMAALMGARSHASLARACDLGVAMQLTNIARDVGEDARAGRIYLPLAWLREANVEPDEWLARPVFTPAIASVVQRLLTEADVLYKRAESGIRELPAGCRPGIFAARYLYAEIGREVEKAGLDSVSSRAHVSFSRKLVLLARALSASPFSGAADPVAPLAVACGLVAVTADAGAMPLSAADLSPPWWNLAARVARTIETFERLERAERDERRRNAEGRLSPSMSAAQ